MAVIKDYTAPCSKCGQPQTIKIYRSINISENPELKEKVKDGSLFLWQCPHCGQVNLAKYDTLYHDPEKKLMIWLIPEGEVSEAQMDAISRHAKAMGGYTLRRVSDMGSLMEKVLINEAGLEDTIIEMCKFVIKAELSSKVGEESEKERLMNLDMHFYKLEDNGSEKLITLMYPEDNTMKGLNIGYNVYENCMAILQRNPSIIPEDGFKKIDSDWIASIMK